MDVYRHALCVASSPSNTKWVFPFLLLADACLCALVIWKIPYTEIDWSTYNQQVASYLNGERDYTLIKGSTGPLVYPALHVYIYTALHWVTNGGENILVAQVFFAGLYLLGLTLVGGVYYKVKAPPYILPLLVLSKRLHSIFVLRLFNDCFVSLALFGTILAFQFRMWTIGALVFSFGVGTKMSLLLALPGIMMVLSQALETGRAISLHGLMLQVQILLAIPFLAKNPWGYLHRAFELSRVFLFKWTVNWRFLGQETFLSQEFSVFLLILHAVLLTLFVSTRWIRPSGFSIPGLVNRVFRPLPPATARQIAARVGPDFVMTSILSSMAIGLLCARTLHYQFYAYIEWATPFLLWKSGYHPIIIYAVWVVQEWAWNVFPSTNTSSAAVVSCLAMQVSGVWRGSRNDFDDVPAAIQSGRVTGEKKVK